MKKLSKQQIAANYAKALYETAQKEKELDHLRQDLPVIINKVLNQDFLKQMDNPILNSEVKKEIIEKISTKLGFSKVTMRFLALLAAESHMKNIENIFHSFFAIDYEKRGILEVFVETAQALTDVQENRLKTGLKKKFQKEIILSTKINEKVLGGLVLRYGSFEIDDSVRGKIESLEQVMKGVK